MTEKKFFFHRPLRSRTQRAQRKTAKECFFGRRPTAFEKNDIRAAIPYAAELSRDRYAAVAV
jgi:hypothetical protein